MKEINYITVIENLCYGAFTTLNNEELQEFLEEYDYTIEDLEKVREISRNIWDNITIFSKMLVITENKIENEPF